MTVVAMAQAPGRASEWRGAERAALGQAQAGRSWAASWPREVKIGELLKARFLYNPSLSPGRASSMARAPLLPNGPCCAVPVARRATGRHPASPVALVARPQPPAQSKEREYVNPQRRQQGLPCGLFATVDYELM